MALAAGHQDSSAELGPAQSGLHTAALGEVLGMIHLSRMSPRKAPTGVGTQAAGLEVPGVDRLDDTRTGAGHAENRECLHHAATASSLRFRQLSGYFARVANRRTRTLVVRYLDRRILALRREANTVQEVVEARVGA